MKYLPSLYLCLLFTVLNCSLPIRGSRNNEKFLYVGKELLKETLPLQNGDRAYQLRGLKSRTWYEVKISYPASIPSTFSLQLNKHASGLGQNHGRKLLNTEKLIFKTDQFLSSINQGGMLVMVNVKPEGVVAQSGKREMEYITFNIVCDELLIGIPHKAWYIVVVVITCLALSFWLSSFLPTLLPPKNGNPPRVVKES